MFYIGVVFILIVNLINVKNNPLNHSDLLFPLSIVISALFLIPIITIYQTKKIYNTSKIFHENVYYCLNNNIVKIKGDTFDSEIRWTHYYKMKETRNFFVLYQGNMVANLLHKKFMNLNDIDEFRLFIRSLKLIRE